MKNNLLIATGIMLLLSGCYCQKYTRGYSSVRFLKASQPKLLCYDPPGMRNGKTVVATIYTGDNAFVRKQAYSQNTNATEINFSSSGLIGLRAEQFYKLGPFPGPLLGIGIDYSRNAFETNYTIPVNKFTIEQKLSTKQQRVNLSFNFVTFIRERAMAYIVMQPGCEFSKQSILTQNHLSTKYNTTTFNWRLGYGFQYYFRPLIAINLEAGYGAGAYIRAGISCWVF